MPNGTPVGITGSAYYWIQSGQKHLISYNDWLAIGAPDALRLQYPLTQAQLNAIPDGSPYVPPNQLHVTSNFVITPVWDSSLSKDPNAASIEATINAAIQVYEAEFSGPENVFIRFAVDPTINLAESHKSTYSIDYSVYVNSLNIHATTAADVTALAHLPTGKNNPVNQSTQVWVTQANDRALGLGALSLRAQALTVPSI